MQRCNRMSVWQSVCLSVDGTWLICEARWSKWGSLTLRRYAKCSFWWIDWRNYHNSYPTRDHRKSIQVESKPSPQLSPQSSPSRVQVTVWDVKAFSHDANSIWGLVMGIADWVLDIVYWEWGMGNGNWVLGPPWACFSIHSFRSIVKRYETKSKSIGHCTGLGFGRTPPNFTID